MRSAVSLALAICLAGSPLPAHAQPQSGSFLSNWGRVRTIVPGTRISVGIAGADEVQQYFLDATDDAITFLDLTNRDIPRAARRTLIRVAETQPGLFTATRWTEVVDRQIRVNQDGVFVKKRRVAPLEDIVRTIDRGDIGEVSRLKRVRQPRPREFDTPPMPIMYGSALLASVVGQACSRCGNAVSLIVLFGTLLGPAVAWKIVHDRHDGVNEVVYRAP